MKTPGSPDVPTAASIEALEEISGVINRVIFHSDDTGYTVCGIAARGHKDEVVVVGNCPTIWTGETLKASGTWTRHRQHGLQFQAQKMACYPPATAEGIERFLASGLIKGVGPVTAQRLVKAFGTETLTVIDRESRRLEEVGGIGPARRELIKQSWKEQKAVRDIMVFLQSHGVGTAHSMRIFKQYGNASVAVVRENPYRLCADVWGIGFKTADRIALNMGVEPQSDIRARAGVLYLLQTLSDEGHCYCPRDELVAAAEQLLEIPAAVLVEAIRHGVAAGTLIDERGNIFLRALHEAEAGVAENLRRLMAASAPYPPIQAAKAVAWAEERMRLAFAPAQRAGLEMALSNQVSIITGGPGVGKTTIVRALVDIFRARRLKVCLAAPTGRAAKRLEESTRADAKTLHRLLKFNPSSGRFEHDAGNALEGNVFILDEVSMIDILLMNAFLRALPDKAVLVLVGDADQLPSVGPGNVLRDLIECGTVPVTRLETIYRQGAQSAIVHNAHRVNSGLPFELGQESPAGDFFFVPAETPEEVIRKMLDLVTSRIPKRFRFNPMTEIQVLTPMRRNELGSENLNTLLQEALNPGGQPLARFNRQYKAGDRVLQIRNNYDKDTFNGDVGLIERIDTETPEIVVNYDGRRVTYAPEELDELDLAYACSVHKSQGSEYPAVVLLMTTQHYKLLQRNLLYTAMTRGRKLVCIVGSLKAVNIAIRNDHVAARRTALRDRLQLRV
jgi:exodeoxyribonuclease V alpha subunit